DLFMTVVNATGKAPADMANLDDNPDTLSPTHLQTGTRDPAPYKFVAPADGKYMVLVGSHLSSTLADVTHYYQVRITPERPDFRLRGRPADQHGLDSCPRGGGGSQDVTVFVARHDGFKGEVHLSVEGLPAGVTCKPQVVGPNMKQGYLVFSAEMYAK